MTFEPFESLEQELRNVESQRERLSKNIPQLRLYQTTDEDRRNVTKNGLPPNRRQGERRPLDRAVAGRRTLAERRLPPQERLAQWQTELEQVVERGVALANIKQNYRR